MAKIDSSKYPKISVFTTQQDHDNILRKMFTAVLLKMCPK